MSRNIVQRFLYDTIKVNGKLPIQFLAFAGLLIPYFNSSLPFERGQINVQRAFQARLVENHRMKSVGQRTDFFECILYNLSNLDQIAGISIGALQHGANGSKNLAK